MEVTPARILFTGRDVEWKYIVTFPDLIWHIYIASSIICTIRAGVGFGPRLAHERTFIGTYNRLTMSLPWQHYQAMTLHYSQEVISTKNIFSSSLTM